MAQGTEGRVAVYIDFDNIVISRYNQLFGRGAFQNDRVRHIDPDAHEADPDVLARIQQATVDIGAILDYASSYGQIVSSCAYADWSQPVNASYRRQLIDRAVELTQMFPLSATKNGADIRLAIDVVEDLFRLPDVTHVVLVAGDSDYVALAQRVKRLGRTIVAVGVAGATGRSLPSAVNEFSSYDDLPGIGDDDTDEDAPTTDAAPMPTHAEPAPEASDPDATEATETVSPKAASRLLRRALSLGHDKAGHDEWLYTSEVKQQIKRMDPSFHEKALGYSSFGDFVRSRNSIAELDKSTNGQRVRLRNHA